MSSIWKKGVLNFSSSAFVQGHLL